MPKHHKKGTNTKIFITLLVVAGVLNLLTRVENTLFSSIMFTANFAIYVGLLLFWMQSLTTRLLPTRVRFYIRCTAFFMVFLLLCRVFRYRVVTNDIFLYRYMIYVYWIPQVMIPALFLMTSVRIGVGEAEGKKPIDALILVPAVCLCLLALTNDYHFLAYVPTGELELSNFKQGDYTYSIGFFLLNGWMILTALAGIIVLIRVTRKHPGRILPWILLILGVWITLEMILFFVISPYDLPRMYNSPELRVFGMLGIQEVCIRSRLIPHNDRHIEFFEKITLPVLLTDRELKPVYHSEISPELSEEEMIRALSEPVYLDEDTRLSGMKMPEGCAFWTEDETELHKESRRLASVIELLSEENELIAMEQSLKEQKAHLDAEAKVYAGIASAIYPKQKKIESILSGISPEDPGFPKALAMCCVLNAWSKRKSNLLLLREETLPKSNRELFLALQESARFLGCLGVEAAAVGEEYTDFPLPYIRDLYDTFETLLEAWIPYMKRMTVSLTATGVRLAVEADGTPALPETLLPVKMTESDEITFLTISGLTGGGGE